MIRAMHTASTGMFAQQMNIDTIANNLANVNTTGFKRSRAEFGRFCSIKSPRLSWFECLKRRGYFRLGCR